MSVYLFQIISYIAAASAAVKLSQLLSQFAFFKPPAAFLDINRDERVINFYCKEYCQPKEKYYRTGNRSTYSRRSKS